MQVKNREYALDIVKILATFCIFMHHYQQWTGVYFNHGVNFYYGRFHFGNVVSLFFIISGYFTYGYIEKLQKGLSFKDFFIKKYVRFLPLMVLSATIYFLLGTSFFNTFGYWHLDKPLNVAELILTFLGVQCGWVVRYNNINPPLWYLSVLILCYLIFYLIVVIAKKIKVNPVIFFGIISASGLLAHMFYRSWPVLNVSSGEGFCGFFAGLCLAAFLKKYKTPMALYIVSVIMVPLGIVLYIKFSSYINAFLFPLINYVYFPAVIIAFKAPFFDKVFNHRIFGIIGQFTLGTYIWHCPFVMGLVLLRFKYIGEGMKFGSYRMVLGYIAVCILLGAASFYLIEKPFTKLTDKMFSSGKKEQKK